MRAIRSLFTTASRNFRATAIKRSENHEGIPGSNLPFAINNRYKLTALFIVFFGSGFAIPFVVVRYHLTK